MALEIFTSWLGKYLPTIHLDFKEWLLNIAIFSHSYTVISEIHILSWRFSWRAVNSQWAHGRRMSNNRHAGYKPTEVKSFSNNLFHYTRALYNHFSYLLKRIRFRGSGAKLILKKLVNLPKQIAVEGKGVDFCEPSRKDCTHHTSENVFHHSFAAVSFSRLPIILACTVFFCCCFQMILLEKYCHKNR